MRAHPTPLFPVITVSPFTKWGIDYTTCNPPSAKGHKYIIVAVDYFTKWFEAMPTFGNDGETAALFLSTRLLLVLVFLKIFSLIMAVIFRIA